MLDEVDNDFKILLGKTSTFKQVIEKDSAFFARTGIIDYSLLLGKVETPEDVDEDNLEWLYGSIIQDPSLAHGLYVTEAKNVSRNKN